MNSRSPSEQPDPSPQKEKGPGPDTPGAPTPGSAWHVPVLNMEFVWIPALAFWVGKYEVTNAEYRLVIPLHASGEFEGQSLDGDRQPAVSVTYDDAVADAESITHTERAQQRLPEGYVYRLPAGDEWTVFAQCGDGRRYPWGNEWPPACGNYRGQASARRFKIAGYDTGLPVTCPVEASGENPWGLFGVGGNVWEWTSEERNGHRALRGASWFGNEREVLECGYRFFSNPAYGYNHTGFRLVLAPVNP